MNSLTAITHSELETADLGRRLGIALEPGLVIALDGTLGSGKTRMVQGISAGLNVDSRQVVSPTFTLCIPYSGRLRMLHLDAYRIQYAQEVDELGLDELVEEGWVLVAEWATRIRDWLPPISLQVDISIVDHTTRRICMSANGATAQHMLQAFSVG
jgi:tRNA threonylcarbamoyladenosine biosynthesis protein TsaE